MKTRRSHARGQMVAATCTAIGAIAAAPGCANDNPVCVTTESNLFDGGAPDDGDDTGPGYLAVTGTFNSATCPSVNPISIGPDNGGVVDLSAMINNGAQDAGPFTVAWTASYGTFSNPGALDTMYFCTLAGLVSVTFTISSSGCPQQQSAGTIHCTTVIGSE